MTVRISAAHRDAIYELILERLSHIDDLWRAVDAKNYDIATRLGEEYCTELLLIIQDLGWGEGPGRSIELSAPPEISRRVFKRLRDRATGEHDSRKAERNEFRALEERTRLVSEACETVLAELDQAVSHEHPGSRCPGPRVEVA